MSHNNQAEQQLQLQLQRQRRDAEKRRAVLRFAEKYNRQRQPREG